MPKRPEQFKPIRLAASAAPPIVERRPNAYQRGYCDSRHASWRRAVLVRDNYTCVDCGRVCSEKREAHADHVSPVVHGTDRCENGASRYDISNGACRCITCHARKTARE
jgi:5-methylcytosine-specific restriction endonuclease McrA